MGKYLVAKVVGALMSALATAIGYALNISQLANIGNEWWPLITFVIFVGLVMWIITDLYKANRRLLDVRPSINVQPIEDNGVFYLKVHNNGAEGTFQAQIELGSSDPSTYPFYPLSQYNGFWESTKKDYAEILRGHDGKIRIAQRMSSPNSTSVHLRIFYYSASANQLDYVGTSSHWIGGYIQHPNGKTQPLTKHEYKLCVTISSRPSLREGIFKAKYLLTIDGLGVDSNSQLTSHKEGSQT